jgi:hypothetical protein
MKRIIVLLILLGVIFVVSPAAYAGDIDGIWGIPGSFDDLIMVRENSGVVIVIILDLANYNTPYDFIAYVGNQSGSVISLVDTAYNVLDVQMTVTLTSTNTATIFVNNYMSKSPYYYCIYPSGVYFDIVKLF